VSQAKKGRSNVQVIEAEICSYLNQITNCGYSIPGFEGITSLRDVTDFAAKLVLNQEFWDSLPDTLIEMESARQQRYQNTVAASDIWWGKYSPVQRQQMLDWISSPYTIEKCHVRNHLAVLVLLKDGR
jgi:hypothetical protein